MEYQIEDIIEEFDNQFDTNVEQLWNSKSDTYHVNVNENGNEMITLNDKELYINSLDKVVPIKRLFRHKVSKEKWKIVTPNNEPLYITGDHSVIVERNGEAVEVPPRDIKDTDYLYVMNGYIQQLVSVKDCIIEQDGQFDNEYVYDIEVNDNSHMFVGNNILLHNSIYVRMDAVLKKLFGTTKVDWNNNDIFSKIRDYVDTDFQIKLNDYCADFICNKFFTDQRRIQFKREKISAQGEYCSKKHYIVHVYDNEGLPCNKWAYVGVEIKKNELPNTIKKLLQEAVEGLIEFDWDNNKFQNKIRQMYDYFCNMSIKDISYIKNLGTPKKMEGFLAAQKGAGAHAKAAQFYNQIITKLGLDNKYEQIRQFDRFHYIYIKENNKFGINVIGFKDRYPKEFEKLFEVDRDKMFDKTVLSPLKHIISNHKFGVFDPSETTIMGEDNVSIFDL